MELHVRLLLSRDGVGLEARGLQSITPVLENLHKAGWKVKGLSWQLCVNQHLKQWALEFGLFINLDTYYLYNILEAKQSLGCLLHVHVSQLELVR